MSKIRVLQLVPTFQCGGAERMVVNLMTHLDRQHFEPAAISLGSRDGWVLEQRLAEEGLAVCHLGKRPGLDARMPLRIRKVLGRLQPHVVHSHLCAHYVFPSLIGLRRLPHITTVHLPGDTKYERVVLPLMRLAFRCGVIPVAVSRDVAEWVERTCGVADCALVPNGISLADYQCSLPARQAWRKEHGFRGEDVLFVCIARLEKQKNHAMLIEAFQKGPALATCTHLLIVGDGSERAHLQSRVRDCGLQGRIHFLGQRSDVPQILAAADVFVLASQNEGNPLSVMEAMAAGLPVVATAVGGIRELVANQQTGLLVTPGHDAGLAAAMLLLLQNLEMRRGMAVAAAQHAMRTFSAARMAQEYARLYERVAARQISAAKVPHTEVGIQYPN
jgi:glycosyltransferase involved in cell wall biosynthesis